MHADDRNVNRRHIKSKHGTIQEQQISDSTGYAHEHLQNVCQPHPDLRWSGLGTIHFDYPMETPQRRPDYRTRNHYWYTYLR